MRSAALLVVQARFAEAQLAVDGKTDFRGVLVFLAVIFPPANRAQHQSTRRIEGLRSAARAAIAHSNRRIHIGMDGKRGGRGYGEQLLASNLWVRIAHSEVRGRTSEIEGRAELREGEPLLGDRNHTISCENVDCI